MINQKIEKANLPNFIIVGAAKSGTTSLNNCISQHPLIFMSKLKEPAFFVDDYPRRVKSLDEYKSLFKDAGDAKAMGEASTAYLFSPQAAAKIKDLLGNIKIIIILRNPMDMAYSLWGWLSYRYGFETLPFEEALEKEDERMNDTTFRASCIEWHASFYYFHRGLYFDQVKRYIDIFGKENVLIHLFDDFIKDAPTLCKKTFEFLQVNGSFISEIKHNNPASAPISPRFQKLMVNPPAFLQKLYNILPIGPRITIFKIAQFVHSLNQKKEKPPLMTFIQRELLYKKYKNDITKLENMIERDLSIWEPNNTKANPC